MSGPVTLSEFARLQGVSPSYVTKLKHAGRLVLTADGRVDVEASRARIRDTEDPNRDDVRARHARARGGEDPSPPDPQGHAAQGFASARAVKERYFALSAKLEYERAIARVVDVATVQAAGVEVGTFLRAAIEALPDQIAPILAEGDPERERRIHGRLREHVEMVLTELADKLKQIAHPIPAP